VLNVLLKKVNKKEAQIALLVQRLVEARKKQSEIAKLKQLISERDSQIQK
jgi:hypothetical protein